MSRRANPTVIGIFVVTGVALLVIALIVLGGANAFAERLRYVMYFDGSVKGLSVGAPVTFRGVKIGTVKDVSVEVDPVGQRFSIPVYVEIEPERLGIIGADQRGPLRVRDVQPLIDKGLRAQLLQQSFVTGQLYVQLDFHPDTPVKLVGATLEAIEIPTLPTPIEELGKKIAEIPVEQLLENFSVTLESIRRLASAPELLNAVRRLDSTLQSVEALSQRLESSIEPVTAEFVGTLREARVTLQEASTTLIEARNAVQSVNGAAQAASGAAVSAERTLVTAQGLLTDDSPMLVEMNAALREVANAARALHSLADTLERQPEALIRGRSDTGVPP